MNLRNRKISKEAPSNQPKNRELPQEADWREACRKGRKEEKTHPSRQGQTEETVARSRSAKACAQQQKDPTLSRRSCFQSRQTLTLTLILNPELPDYTRVSSLASNRWISSIPSMHYLSAPLVPPWMNTKICKQAEWMNEWMAAVLLKSVDDPSSLGFFCRSGFVGWEDAILK